MNWIEFNIEKNYIIILLIMENTEDTNKYPLTFDEAKFRKNELVSEKVTLIFSNES